MDHGFWMIVCIKQVPDLTAEVAQPLRADGTLNRGAYPLIVNPDDLCALEAALMIKEQQGGRVIVVSMGPPCAAEALRECLFRGADEAVLLCDGRFAGSDTLATASILAAAIHRLGGADLILCGRQSADGETGHVGPQIASLLGIPQITSVDKITSLNEGVIRVERSLEDSRQVVEAQLPCLLTVNRAADKPRLPNARLIGRFNKARAPSEVAGLGIEMLRQRGLLIEEWNADTLGIESHRCGLEGSATRIACVAAMNAKQASHVEIEPTEAGMDELVRQLKTSGVV